MCITWSLNLEFSQCVSASQWLTSAWLNGGWVPEYPGASTFGSQPLDWITPSCMAQRHKGYSKLVGVCMPNDCWPLALRALFLVNSFILHLKEYKACSYLFLCSDLANMCEYDLRQFEILLWLNFWCSKCLLQSLAFNSFGLKVTSLEEIDRQSQSWWK